MAIQHLASLSTSTYTTYLGLPEGTHSGWVWLERSGEVKGAGWILVFGPSVPRKQLLTLADRAEVPGAGAGNLPVEPGGGILAHLIAQIKLRRLREQTTCFSLCDHHERGPPALWELSNAVHCSCFLSSCLLPGVRTFFFYVRLIISKFAAFALRWFPPFIFLISNDSLPFNCLYYIYSYSAY